MRALGGNGKPGGQPVMIVIYLLMVLLGGAATIFALQNTRAGR